MTLEVLIVDDDALLLKAFKRVLWGHCNVHIASSAERALELLATKHIDVIITDNNMPEKSGVWLLGNVRALYPNVMRILTSGIDVGPALHTGLAQLYLRKPINLDELRCALGLYQDRGADPVALRLAAG